MQYWLFKSDPEDWSWKEQEKAGPVFWDGVRGHQAHRYLKECRAGDQVLFYETGRSPCIKGVMQVVSAFSLDPQCVQGKWGGVTVKAVASFSQPIPLSWVKKQEIFQSWALVLQPRLSVMPVIPSLWTFLMDYWKTSCANS